MIEKQTKIKTKRLKLGINQTAFWSPVGVGQSGGSRYESGREIPSPVKLLLELAYGKSPLKALAKIRNTTIEALTEEGK